MTDALTAAGWKVNYGPEKQVIIGTSGSILKSTVKLLHSLLPDDKHDRDTTLYSLNHLAVNKAFDIIRTRRIEEGKIAAGRAGTSSPGWNTRPHR